MAYLGETCKDVWAEGGALRHPTLNVSLDVDLVWISGKIQLCIISIKMKPNTLSMINMTKLIKYKRCPRMEPWRTAHLIIYPQMT